MTLASSFWNRVWGISFTYRKNGYMFQRFLAPNSNIFRDSEFKANLEIKQESWEGGVHLHLRPQLSGRRGQEDQELKASLGDTARSRPYWAPRDLVSKNKTRKKNMKDSLSAYLVDTRDCYWGTQYEQNLVHALKTQHVTPQQDLPTQTLLARMLLSLPSP